MKRKFKVVGHLNLADLPLHFRVTGGLKFSQPGHRSLRAAVEEAKGLATAGWFATVIRRVPGGWIEVAGFNPAPCTEQEA